MYLSEPLSAGHPSRTLKDRVKLLLGAAVFPNQTRRWKRFVQAHPVLCELAPVFPRIVHKIYRPFWSNHLDCRQRVTALMSHYTAIAEAGLGQLVRGAALAPLTLAELRVKSGAPVTLHLSAINVAHREGELALVLSTQGRPIYTLSFSFIWHDDALQIALGGLQGLRADDGADIIRQLTREMYGWRPKNVMVAALRQVGMRLGCRKLLLVSNQNRIVVNWRRTSRISADYDALWLELKAVRRDDGNYELPCQPDAPRELESVPSHKRSEFRKRLGLQTEIDSQIAATLHRYRSNESV